MSDKGEKAPPAIQPQYKYDGEFWGIYYLPISSFEEELPKLGETLDYMEENHGEVIAVIPNMGITPTSILLGTFPRRQEI